MLDLISQVLLFAVVNEMAGWRYCLHSLHPLFEQSEIPGLRCCGRTCLVSDVALVSVDGKFLCCFKAMTGFDFANTVFIFSSFEFFKNLAFSLHSMTRLLFSITKKNYSKTDIPFWTLN